MEHNKNIPSTSEANTDCKQGEFEFQGNFGRKVVATFDGGELSSEGGLLIVRQLMGSLRLPQHLAQCFHDRRDPTKIEHSVAGMIAQRLSGMVVGYEDLNDHGRLRTDPLMRLAAGKDAEPGASALASPSTLNRLELSSDRMSDYHKVHADGVKLADLLLARGVATLRKGVRQIILDFDATDTILHGNQEGRHYHGYYGDYCYLPLIACVGEVPLLAKLRPSDRDGSEGTVEALEKIIPALRRRCPKAKIIVRADSGFCRDDILAWCEKHGVHYAIGLAQNSRLLERIADPLMEARRLACLLPGPARVFTRFQYRTLDTWSRARDVVAKAERLGDKDNPRFVVTNLPGKPRWLYEDFYCARGEMENRIKEQQLHLFADRLSTESFQANQLRLWFSAFAQQLIERLRNTALKGSRLARATAATIRLHLLKLAVRVEVSVRRVRVRFARDCPAQDVFAHAWARLMRLPQPSG